MVPYLDGALVDGWPVVLDFSAVVVTHNYGDTQPLYDANWVARCFWAAWQLWAPAGVLRMLTHQGSFTDPLVRQGKPVRPGEMIRVNVVPKLAWVPGPVGGYSPLVLDRWPYLYQTPETFVATAYADSPERVGWNIVHELIHTLTPTPWTASHKLSPQGHDPATFGTVYSDRPIPNPTFNAAFARKLFGDAMADFAAGWRYHDNGDRYKLPGA